MSIFDEDINLKNLETIALFKQIRTIVDWININLSQYRESILYDVSPLSILRKNGYDVDIIPNEILKTSDMWEKVFSPYIPVNHQTPNYKTELIIKELVDIDDLSNLTYKKHNFIFSRVEIVIINGEPYIKCIGNNIIHMRYFCPIPDFIKFIGNPYIVITSQIEEDKISEYRHDCKFIIYDENYTLDNVTEEPYDIRTYHCTSNSANSLNVTNNDTWLQKIDYGTIQGVCSKTIGWDLTQI